MMPRHQSILDEMEEASAQLHQPSLESEGGDSIDLCIEASAELTGRESKEEEELGESFRPRRGHSNPYDRQNVCTVCSKLPLRRPRNAHSDMVWENVANAWDWDDGLLDIIRHFNEAESDNEIPPDLIEETVEYATAHLDRLKKTLTENGLQMHENQNYSYRTINSARVVAPLHISEIEKGDMLGCGGFGVVLDVNRIRLRDCVDQRKFTEPESQSRQYLKSHAIVYPEGVVARKKKSLDETYSSRDALEGSRPRYAIKHLRSNLLSKTNAKFRRAAADLAREGQILMVLDHPGIVSIRGWARDGPASFRNGTLSSFFLILDKLPSTLEDKLWEWRQKDSVNRIRLRRRTAWKGRSHRIKSLLSCSPSPIEVDNQEPPDKYAVKMLSMLIDRLNAAKVIASALAHMHSKRILHRDIKGSNIGFDVHGDAKVFDLGLARLLPQGNGTLSESFLMSRVGSTFYMGPEVLRKESYGPAADVYSFGVVLWEILSLSSARDFYQKTKEDYLEAEKRKKPPPNDYPSLRRIVKNGKEGQWLPICPCWSDSLQSLLKHALANTPKKRPDMSKVERILGNKCESLLCILLRETVRDQTPKQRRSTFRIDLTHLHCDTVDEDSGTGCVLSSGTHRMVNEMQTRKQ